MVDGLVYESAGNVVVDEFSMSKYFFSIKWTRCAVKIPVDPKAKGPNVAKVTTTRGLQEVFSYYGVLGIRVFAPITRGDYSKWQLVVQVPFLGQTSRGESRILLQQYCLDVRGTYLILSKRYRQDRRR